MPEVETLKNGLRIVHRPLPQTGSVAIAVFVGTGGRFEDFDTNYGVTHFLEHLLFKGTQKRPNPKQIPEEIDGLGGYINAYTSTDRTCFYVKLPRQHWAQGLDILADIVLHPLFKEREIDRERGVVIEEMKVDMDDPASYVFDLVGDLLWPTDMLRTNILGNEQIISSIKKSQIRDYYKKHYTINNIVISVSGNLEMWEILNRTNELFNSTTSPKTISPTPTKGTISRTRSSVLEQDTNQSHVVIAARAPQMEADDEMAMRLLSVALGGGLSSRLSLNVRERKGLAYTIYSSYSTYTDSGSFEIYAGINKLKLDQALRAITTELARIRDTNIPERELAKVKEMMKGRLIMGNEDNSNIADRMGSQLILTGKAWPIEETLAKIDKVTAAAIRRAAARYLSPTKLRLALIGPHDQKQVHKFEQILAS